MTADERFVAYSYHLSKPLKGQLEDYHNEPGIVVRWWMMIVPVAICAHGIIEGFAGTGLIEKFLEVHGALLDEKIDWMRVCKMVFGVSKDKRHGTENANDDLKSDVGPIK